MLHAGYKGTPMPRTHDEHEPLRNAREDERDEQLARDLSLIAPYWQGAGDLLTIRTVDDDLRDHGYDPNR